MGEEYSSCNGRRQELEEDEREQKQESEKASLVAWSKDGMGYVLTHRYADETESPAEIRE